MIKHRFLHYDLLCVDCSFNRLTKVNSNVTVLHVFYLSVLPNNINVTALLVSRQEVSVSLKLELAVCEFGCNSRHVFIRTLTAALSVVHYLVDVTTLHNVRVQIR